MRSRTHDGVKALALAAGVAGLVASTPAQAPPFDVLITGGQVLDGTGAAAQRVDVGIRGDRVAAIGPLAGTAGAPRRSMPRAWSWRPASSISTPTPRCRSWPTAPRRARSGRA